MGRVSMKNLMKRLIRPVYTRYEQLVDDMSRAEESLDALHQTVGQLQASVRHLETAVDILIGDRQCIEEGRTGFNGQQHRKRIFEDLIRAVGFEAIIETGTGFGHTTSFMAEAAGLPVHTCETNRRFSALAAMRLQNMPGVTVEHSDSRAFLKRMAETDLSQKRVFFYLDAHWQDDLPLCEELEIICAAWREFVVMVDDFQVPDDDGYGYDTYGPGKELTPDLIADTVSQNGLITRFPSLPSGQETGSRRGCVVIAREGMFTEQLGAMDSLRT